MTWFSLESLGAEPLKTIWWILENPSYGGGIVDAVYGLPIKVSGNNGTAPHLVVRETTYGGKKKFEVMPQADCGPISIKTVDEIITEGAYEQERDGYSFRILSSRHGDCV